MCYGFSGWIHKSGRVFFALPDQHADMKHHTALANMPKEFAKDGDICAFEFDDWTVESFSWDLPSSMLPKWADKQKCVDKLNELLPAVLKFKEKEKEFSRLLSESYANWDRAIRIVTNSRLDLHNDLLKIDGYCPGREYEQVSI